MKIKKGLIIAALATFCLAVTLFATLPTQSQTGAYDPWVDVNDDGSIDMADISIAIDDFMTSGTPLTKAGLLYDSGWIDVSDKAGQYFDVVHNLNSADVIVDVTGKTTADGTLHQRHIGGTDFVAGWNKTYGGTGEDTVTDLVQTTDGGYALAGSTVSFGTGGSWDFWLIKTDSAGTGQWNKTYGVTDHDWAWALAQTTDGGYALAGSTGWDPTVDFWLVKTDAYGNQQWNKTYGGININTNDVAYDLVQTTDGGYALAGSAGWPASDFWLVKTDAYGNQQWNKTYGGTNYDWAWALAQTTDGGYALAGQTNSHDAGISDAWLVKTDAAGNALDGFKYGLAWVNSTANSITLYRGTDDAYWNYVRVRVWKVKDSP